MKKAEPMPTPEGWQPWVSRQQLPDLVPFHIDTIDDLVAAGRFPAPISLGPKKRVWLMRDLIAWQQQVIKDSGAG